MNLKNLPSEFLNRVDELIVFKSLSQEDLEKIVNLMLRIWPDALPNMVYRSR